MVTPPRYFAPTDKCHICGELSLDPPEGKPLRYNLRRTTVSDAHRLMFHSGNPNDLNYDPDYTAANQRIDQIQRDNVARFYATTGEGWQHLKDEHERRQAQDPERSP